MGYDGGNQTISISLNGEIVVFFMSSKGLRQGGQLSPYFFVMIEVHLGMLHEAT